MKKLLLLIGLFVFLTPLMIIAEELKNMEDRFLFTKKAF